MVLNKIFDEGNFKRSLIVVVITLFLDFLFHFYFTSPMESFTYFAAKALVVFVVAQLMFSKPLTFFNILKYDLIFVLMFGVYYRLTEVFSGLYLLAVVPDISIGSFIVTSQTPLFSGLVWGLAHGGFYFVGIWLSNKLGGRL